MRYGVCMHVNTLGPVYLYNYVPEERAYIQGRMNIVETMEPTPDFLAGQTIVKIIYMSLDMSYLQRIEREMAEAGLTDGLDVYYSGNRYLEFNAPGVNKGAGLLSLAARLGIAPEETIAAGDNSNDVSMIRAAAWAAPSPTQPTRPRPPPTTSARQTTTLGPSPRSSRSSSWEHRGEGTILAADNVSELQLPAVFSVGDARVSRLGTRANWGFATG